MKKRLCAVLAGLLITLFTVLAFGEDPGQGACLTAEYRQFDFWVGDWDVFDPNGKKVGENRVEKILAGCGIKENWKSITPSRGRSLNMYDQGRKLWHQTWVDNGGLLLRLEGGLNSKGSMVLEGNGYDPSGKPFHSRITWTPKGKTVHQLWEVSSDSGKNWQTMFDGTYKRK